MSRSKRQKSNTKVYHIIIRGINKQDLFLDKQDYLKFLKEIDKTKEKYKYKIYAYALMNNHVHLILKDENENLELVMKSITVSYSNYFNKKYERVGHLFENRFKSHAIELKSYLKNVIRYIHKNPENAGLKPYIWTSYYEYLCSNPKIIRKEIVMNLFNSIEEFVIFHKDYKNNQDYDKDYEMINKLQDEEAIEAIKQISGESNLIKIQNYEKNKKRETIQNILKIEGITKTQVARILGINRKTIDRINISN